jgi:tetratricopeptide (TPR) repeat protein
MRYLLFWFFSVVGSVTSAAGAGFDERLARADSLLRQRQTDAAAGILDSLCLAARARGTPAEELKVLLAQARLHGLVGRPKPGRSSATAALEIATTLRDTLAISQALRWLAVAAQLEGAMPEARVHAQRLIDLARRRADRFHEGQGALLLAYGDLVAGNLQAAEPEYEQAARNFAEVGNLVFELMARQGLGQIRQIRGDVEGARRCFQRVLEGSRALGDPFGEARALNDLGVLEFTYGDPSDAVTLYQRALELQVRNGDLAGSVTGATNLAITHTYLGEFEEAWTLLDETRRRCEEAGYRGALVNVLTQMGIVSKERGRYGEAARCFREAMRFAREASPDQRARNLTGLAETLAFRDSIAAGLALLEERFPSIRDSISAEDLFSVERVGGNLLLWLNRPAEALVHFRRAERIGRALGFSFLVGTLTYEGVCHDRCGRADSAGVCLQRAVEAWESERARIRDPGWREQLLNDGRRLYTELARHILDDRLAASPSEPARAAFDALQRFKARTLRERMLGAFSAQGDSLTGSSTTPEAIRGSVTVAELQERCLDADELLLDIFVGNDGIYIFAVTRTECRAVRTPYDLKALEETLRRYRDLVATRPAPSRSRRERPGTEESHLLEAAGRHLSSLFFAPVADLLLSHARLILALDGYLNLIPIEAWPLPLAPDSPGVAEPLLARKRITRVPSATMLRDQRSRMTQMPAARAPARVLAVLGGEPAVSGATAAPGQATHAWRQTLPGARGEVAWLRRSFREVRVRETAGSEDTASWVGDLDRCDVIHLASHVRIDDVHPWRSGLPQLRAQQVARMRLPARLAVLAGCESAGGRVVSGEGVLGLTSAFAAANVPSVVATLWPVSDRVTARLVRAFYASLAKGRPVGEALRAAQLSVRGDPRTRHPFYWAGLVLVGDEGARVPLERAWMARTWLRLAAAVAVLAGVGLTGWRRSRRSA